MWRLTRGYLMMVKDGHICHLNCQKKQCNNCKRFCQRHICPFSILSLVSKGILWKRSDVIFINSSPKTTLYLLSFIFICFLCTNLLWFWIAKIKPSSPKALKPLFCSDSVYALARASVTQTWKNYPAHTCSV